MAFATDNRDFIDNSRLLVLLETARAAESRNTAAGKYKHEHGERESIISFQATLFAAATAMISGSFSKAKYAAVIKTNVIQIASASSR